MIYTITFNPSLDYVVSVDEFQTGKLNRTKEEYLFPGGKGINVSVVLTSLGTSNTALGFVGGFTGVELDQMLANEGILTNFIPVCNGITRVNCKLKSLKQRDDMVDADKTENADSENDENIENTGYVMEETEINGMGPMISEVELEQLFTQLETLTAEDILIVSGSVSKGVPQNIYADIVKLCNEKQVKVILDASSALLWNAIENRPFLIKPNQNELGDIFNREIYSDDEILFYAKELQNRGAENVLVSRGKKGAVLVASDGNIYISKAPIYSPKNTVGSGDSMVAGFVFGLLNAPSNENVFLNALKFGTAAGSATAFSEGLAKKQEILALLDEVEVSIYED